jgi:hypothetical protein
MDQCCLDHLSLHSACLPGNLFFYLNCALTNPKRLFCAQGSVPLTAVPCELGSDTEILFAIFSLIPCAFIRNLINMFRVLTGSSGLELTPRAFFFFPALESLYVSISS